MSVILSPNNRVGGGYHRYRKLSNATYFKQIKCCLAQCRHYDLRAVVKNKNIFKSSVEHHNNSKNKDKSEDKPDLIQEIERFEPKELIEIAADNLENDIKCS